MTLTERRRTRPALAPLRAVCAARFLFYLPPIRIWEVVAFPWPLPRRERFDVARLLVRSDRMQEKAIEVRVFVNQPNANSRTKTIGNPAYAGAVGFIGHGTPRRLRRLRSYADRIATRGSGATPVNAGSRRHLLAGTG